MDTTFREHNDIQETVVPLAASSQPLPPCYSSNYYS